MPLMLPSFQTSSVFVCAPVGAARKLRGQDPGPCVLVTELCATAGHTQGQRFNFAKGASVAGSNNCARLS